MELLSCWVWGRQSSLGLMLWCIRLSYFLKHLHPIIKGFSLSAGSLTSDTAPHQCTCKAYRRWTEHVGPSTYLGDPHGAPGVSNFGLAKIWLL